MEGPHTSKQEGFDKEKYENLYHEIRSKQENESVGGFDYGDSDDSIDSSNKKDQKESTDSEEDM